MSITDAIKGTLLTSNVPLRVQSKEPSQYADRANEYYSAETLSFVDEYARYSSDYCEAEIQGLNPSEPFEYTTVHIRLADIITSSASATQQMDNKKNILIAEKEYTYLRKGAKVRTMGSTWLVINPANISNGDGKGIIQKCDALWHYLDYYGNVCAEPLAIGQDYLRANDPDAQRNTMIAKGYFEAKMQYNDATKQLLQNNTRMILGSGAYYLSGFMDFIQEFTDDEKSVNILQFNMRYTDPNYAIDDMENKVANGLTFHWDIKLEAPKSEMQVGDSIQIIPTSYRTNENSTEQVESTEEYPIDYIWRCYPDDVCAVDWRGNVTALSEGECTVTATLMQNQSVKTTYTITVSESINNGFKISTTNTGYLRAYESALFSAILNGDLVADVKWTLSGADESAYSYSEDNGILTVKCWNGNTEALVIKAEYEGKSDEFKTWLIGL